MSKVKLASKFKSLFKTKPKLSRIDQLRLSYYSKEELAKYGLA
ncbi:MAG: hypothetical protein ACXAD7_06205 [Candidatus Kariarchaeaceae archaeon]